MPRPLPTSASLRAPARARGWNPRALPPVLLGLSVPTDVDLTSPSTLLDRCVRVGAVVNPALETVLVAAGAEPRGDGRSWNVVVDGRGAVPHDDLVRILRSLVPGACFTAEAATRAAGREGSGLGRLSRKLIAANLDADLRATPSVAAALAEAGITFDDRKFRDRARDAGIVLRRTGRTLQISVATVGFAADVATSVGLDADAFDTLRPTRVHSPAQVPPADVDLILDAAADRQIGVVDASSPARVAALRELAAAAVVVDRVPGSPGQADLRVGSLVDSAAAPGVRAAAEGLAIAGAHHLEAPVAVHPDVVEAADQSLAGPAGRPGLREHQDHFASVYAVTVRGVVNALDPGMGKTITTAAAFAEKAARRRGWRGLVAVPSGLRNQWRAEFGRFFPESVVDVVNGADDVPGLPDRLTAAGDRPVTVIVSHDAAARYVDELAALRWSDVALDEGDWLRTTTSARTKALWQIRASAECGTALTGTPVDRALGNVAALVAWSRNDPTIAEIVDTDEAALWARLGASVFRWNAGGSELPGVAVNIATITAGRAEQQIVSAAMAELTAAHRLANEMRAAGDTKAAARARLARKTALDAARVAACDPVAFASAKASERIDPALIAKACSDGGAKRAWAVEVAVRAAAGGGQVLVCTDFPAAANAIATAAADAGLRTGALTGDVTPVVRTSLAAAFTHGQLDMLCLSGAGARGLNLQTATDVINLDLPTSAATLRQRAGRAIRIGSTREKVTIHVPVLDGSLDAALVRTLQPVLDQLADPDGRDSTLAIDLTSDDGIAGLLAPE